MEDTIKDIGESLSSFQAALNQQGMSLEEFIRQNYSNKWLSDDLYHVMAIRTTFVNSSIQFLINEGLFNMERIMLSIITDPLAHDIEYTPSIKYKGHTYLTTHSMIYSKFLACSNPNIKGVFVDSPNIRLEIESPFRIQRSKYIIDFSQIDLEIKRNRNVTLEDYFYKQKKVAEILNEDMDIIKNFFERMIAFSIEEVVKKNKDALEKLGVILEVPKIPFPTFLKDESIKKYNQKTFEEKLGEETDSQFFWVAGLLRENYDLLYPFLMPEGKKVSMDAISSKNIFNYDLYAKSIDAKTGKQTPAREILSGAIREWLYEPIVERIIENKVLKARPIIKDGNILNIEELGGYGPFLYFVSMHDKDGKPVFPDTMGGGIGVERTLYSLLRGEKIKKIDDVTYFGKNPDSHPLYLY